MGALPALFCTVLTCLVLLDFESLKNESASLQVRISRKNEVESLKNLQPAKEDKIVVSNEEIFCGLTKKERSMSQKNQCNSARRRTGSQHYDRSNVNSPSRCLKTPVADCKTSFAEGIARDANLRLGSTNGGRTSSNTFDWLLETMGQADVDGGSLESFCTVGLSVDPNALSAIPSGSWEGGEGVSELTATTLMESSSSCIRWLSGNSTRCDCAETGCRKLLGCVNDRPPSKESDRGECSGL